MAWELAAVIVMLGTIGFLSYFAKNLEENHWYLKLGFFLIGFFLLLSTLSFGRILASDNGASNSLLSIMDTAYLVILWVTIFVMFYALLLLIFYAVGKWQQHKKGDQFGDDVDEVITSG